MKTNEEIIKESLEQVPFPSFKELMNSDVLTAYATKILIFALAIKDKKTQ